ELTIENDPDQEAEDVAWVPLDEVASRLAYPNERRVVATARDGLIGRTGVRTRSGGTATVRPLAVRHGHARRRARALLATLVALVGVIGLAGVDPPAHADDGDLVVEIATVAPAVLRTGDELTISGRIENTSDDEIPAPAVRLVMQRHVPASTDALAQWLDGTSTLNVTTLSRSTLEDPVAAGASVPFTVTIPTDGTFDQFSAWGPRGIAIQVSSGGLADEARTALLW